MEQTHRRRGTAAGVPWHTWVVQTDFLAQVFHVPSTPARLRCWPGATYLRGTAIVPMRAHPGMTQRVPVWRRGFEQKRNFGASKTGPCLDHPLLGKRIGPSCLIEQGEVR